MYLEGIKMKDNKSLIFEEVEETTNLENSAGCKTNGSPSGCCTTYCTDHGPTCKVQGDVWGKFLEENGGIIQY